MTNTSATANYIPTDKHYPNLSKASSAYLEIEHFKSADLHSGYFATIVLLYKEYN
jgi:hypothetical protein